MRVLQFESVNSEIGRDQCVSDWTVFCSVLHRECVCIPCGESAESNFQQKQDDFPGADCGICRVFNVIPGTEQGNVFCHFLNSMFCAGNYFYCGGQYHTGMDCGEKPGNNFIDHVFDPVAVLWSYLWNFWNCSGDCDDRTVFNLSGSRIWRECGECNGGTEEKKVIHMRYFVNKFGILFLTFTVMEQLIAASSTYAMIRLGSGIMTGEGMIWFGIFVLSLVLVFVPQIFSQKYMTKAEYAAFQRYLSRYECNLYNRPFWLESGKRSVISIRRHLLWRRKIRIAGQSDGKIFGFPPKTGNFNSKMWKTFWNFYMIVQKRESMGGF